MNVLRLIMRQMETHSACRLGSVQPVQVYVKSDDCWYVGWWRSVKPEEFYEPNDEDILISFIGCPRLELEAAEEEGVSRMVGYSNRIFRELVKLSPDVLRGYHE